MPKGPIGDLPDGPRMSPPNGSVRCNSEESIMANVSGKMEGNILTLTIDCSPKLREQAQPSKSGKSKILATTSGFTGFGDVKVSLNATIG